MIGCRDKSKHVRDWLENDRSTVCHLLTLSWSWNIWLENQLSVNGFPRDYAICITCSCKINKLIKQVVIKHIKGYLVVVGLGVGVLSMSYIIKIGDCPEEKNYTLQLLDFYFVVFI